MSSPPTLFMEYGTLDLIRLGGRCLGGKYHAFTCVHIVAGARLLLLQCCCLVLTAHAVAPIRIGLDLQSASYHPTICTLSGVLLKMEVGIRKGAWRRA